MSTTLVHPGATVAAEVADIAALIRHARAAVAAIEVQIAAGTDAREVAKPGRGG